MNIFNREELASKTKRRHTIGYKGILKEITNNATSNIHNNNDSEKIKRRVSFAPEVTLHKINIIPQSSSSSSRSSSMSLASDRNDDKEHPHSSDLEPTDDDDEDEEVHQSPFVNKILAMENHDADDGDDDNEGEVEGNSSDVDINDNHKTFQDHDFAENDLHDMDLTEIRFDDIFKAAKDGSGRKTLIFNHDNAKKNPKNIDEDDPTFTKIGLLSNNSSSTKDFPEEKMTMELTETFKTISKTTEVEINDADDEMESTKEMTMEVTKVFKIHQELKHQDDEMVNEETMEFTKPINFNDANNTMDEGQVEETMEFTKPINTNNADNKTMDEGQVEETMEFTKPINTNNADNKTMDEDQVEETMELTKPISIHLKTNFGNREEEVEGTMEFTKPVKLPLVSENSMDNEEETMEFTKPIKVPQLSSQPQNVSKDFEDTEETMEFTKPVNIPKLQSDLKEIEESQEIAEDSNNVEETMEFTKPIHLPPLNKPLEKPSLEPPVHLDNHEFEIPEEDVNINQTKETSDDINKSISSSKDSSVNEGDKTVVFGSPEKSMNLEGDDVLNSELRELSDEEEENNEEEDEDSEIYPDEKTIANTIANSMLGPRNAPITSSPIKENYMESIDEGEVEMEAEKDKENLSPTKELLNKVTQRKLPSPSHLQTSPLRKALLTERMNINELLPIKESTLKLPSLNFTDSSILNLDINSRKRRQSLPIGTSKRSKSVNGKRKTISFAPSNSVIMEREDEERSVVLAEEDPFLEPEPVVNISEESVDNYEPITIQQFLEEIGIKFFDDMNHSTILSTSLLPKKNEIAPTQLDYGRSNEQLSRLELLTYGCKELRRYIKEGQDFFDQLSKEIAEENPSTIKEYYTSTGDVKNSMVEQFHLSKNFAKVEAKNDWYNWKSQLIDDIIMVMEKRLKDLEKQGEALDGRVHDYEQLESILINRYSEIEKRYQQIMFQNDFMKKNNSAKEELVRLRKELVTVTDELTKNQNLINELEENYQILSKEISNKHLEIAQMKKSIKENETELKLSKNFENIDVLNLKENVDSFIKEIGIKLVDINQISGEIVFKLVNDDADQEEDGIKIKLNYLNLKDFDKFSFEIGKNFKFNRKIFCDDENNFNCKIINSHLKEYLEFNFQKFIKSENIKNFTNVLELFNFFRKIVESLKNTFSQLYYLSIKSRANFQISQSDLNDYKKLLVIMRVNIKPKMIRKTVKMEFSDNYINDLLA